MWDTHIKEHYMPTLESCNLVKVDRTGKKRYYLDSHVQEFTEVDIRADSKN